MNNQAARIVRTRTELREAVAAERQKGKKIGFVPTMGALHDGHISLVEKAGDKCECVVASIFVNPTQFAPGEDLDRYPRNEEGDVARLSAAGCNLVYCPSVEEMYPEGSLTNVRVEEMSDLLDGIYRPHFFYGVATVVARLFIHVQPDVAVFGEKDYQQLQIIKRMVRDLGFAIEVIGGKTWRDPDGLAQSSRNAYLSEEERQRANEIFAALHRAAARIRIGVPVHEAVREARGSILGAGFSKLDYVSAVDPATLQDLPDGPLEKDQGCRLLAAAWMGSTRLIDNIGL
ncbi:pantoate--beta-alanine ligase [Henriciella sp. AS95]|uniref:pantoate--beta-alanine ligase n=1 Tax=Henriciella sp. AS95 TaxID=3135782 RepID=UPI003177A264